MTAGTLLDRFSSGRPSGSTAREAIFLAATLTGGIVGLVPLLTVLSETPLLAWLGVVGAGYGLLVVYLRRLVLGLIVAVFVTSTVAANVPLASRAYLEHLPGMLGPSIWLVHLPMVPLAAVFVQQGRYDPRSLTRTEVIFGLFVVWSVLSAVLGTGPRRDVALYFSLLMGQAWLVFGLAVRTVRDGSVSFRTAVSLLAIPVVGHALFGVAQFLNGGTFGYATLGEISGQFVDPNAVEIGFGPFGSVTSGLFVTGLSGMAFVLASLLLLVLPVLFVALLEFDGVRQAVAAACFVVGAVVLRLTLSDAARGGFLVSVLALAAFGLHYHRRGSGRVRSRVTALLGGLSTYARRGQILAVATLSSLLAILYPSSKSGTVSGRSAQRTTPDALSGGQETPDAPSGGSTTPATPTGSGADVPVNTSGGSSFAVDSVSIPLFNLSNLGIRLQQYAIGVRIFGKNPVFGIGGGNFQYVAPGYGLPRALPLHNLYLALLVETGTIGFLCYTAALGSVLVRGWRLSALAEADRALVLGVLAGLIGYLAFAFWDHLALDRVTSLFPFWLLAGVVVGEYHRRSGDGEREF